jgi:hypothetical protein
VAGLLLGFLIEPLEMKFCLKVFFRVIYSFICPLNCIENLSYHERVSQLVYDEIARYNCYYNCFGKGIVTLHDRHSELELVKTVPVHALQVNDSAQADCGNVDGFRF